MKIIFYILKPFLPRKFQIFLRRQLAIYKRKKFESIWPIDPSAGKPPEGWQGWPKGNTFAVVLTHDVDTERGHKRCYQLMELEDKLGFKSSFNFVPEGYKVSSELRKDLWKRGFEVGVHGLLHDGKLYQSEDIFRDRAARINRYIDKWGSVGFRSPSMHHNLDWIHNLKIEYDASTFDTDPFEIQSDGVGTIFPFFVQLSKDQSGYVELPYTLPQDFTIFIIMKEKTIVTWKEKLNWIVKNNGMVLINTHPDYMSFSSNKLGLEEYPVSYYRQFLEHIKTEYQGEYWNPLPKEMAEFWRIQRQSTHS